MFPTAFAAGQGLPPLRDLLLLGAVLRDEIGLFHFLAIWG